MSHACIEPNTSSAQAFSDLYRDLELQNPLRSEEAPKAPRMLRISRMAKQGLDISGALIGLVILALLLPIIMLCIWLEDRGPVFYKQVRVGQDGRPFIIYKFRSMIVNADTYIAQHPELLEAWSKGGKLKRDPRITRVGVFLRSTSLDELPQMLNILRGEMSLVGPRAIQFSEIEVFGDLIKLRQAVKPGLTGLWQVSGRSMIDYEQRCVLDCTYVMDWSFWLDIEILLRTFPIVMNGIGAC
jgi:exopolysaccharide production protein ExoY